MRKCAYVFCVLFFSNFIPGEWTLLYAQPTIDGILEDEQTHAPIAYANIGILNTSVGTISNPDGSFSISIPEQYSRDSLLFAALGYERKSFLIDDVFKEGKLHVSLREQTTLLKNVTVKSKKLKASGSYDLGNKQYNMGSLYIDSVAAGSAMALLIENRYPYFHDNLHIPYYLRRAKLRISYNTVDRFKIRIRFLAVDPVTLLPGKDLVEESIIATSGMRKGWLDFDLSKYKIRIKEASFFLVFEWLSDDEDRHELLDYYREFRRQYPKLVTTDTLSIDGEKIAYSSWHGFRLGTSFGSSNNQFAIANYKCYYRNNSYGRWRRSSQILCASITIDNFE